MTCFWSVDLLSDHDVISIWHLANNKLTPAQFPRDIRSSRPRNNRVENFGAQLSVGTYNSFFGEKCSDISFLCAHLKWFSTLHPLLESGIIETPPTSIFASLDGEE